MLYLGLSQWNYKFFKENLYPRGSKPVEYIKFYSGRYNCVELNSTYYDNVSKDTMLRWKKSVNPLFRFCPKIPKQITHDNLLNTVQQFAREFINSVSTLGENLGISYLQLSPAMHPNDLYLIDELLEFINNEIPVSMEIRPGWMADTALLNECLAILKKHNAGVVIVDSVETVKYLNHIKLTNDTAFIRFLSYGHRTDYARIDDWIKIIRLWQKKGIKEIYFILHTPDSESEPLILKYTREKLFNESGIGIC